MSDVRQIGGINLYFPFLDLKDGRIVSLCSELSWLIVYSLFADRILIPPRSLFSGKFALQNLAGIYREKILTEMADSGILISTATNKIIGDSFDLFEHYSGLIAERQLGFQKMPVYYRDEFYQRKLASMHLANSINSNLEMPTYLRRNISHIASNNLNQDELSTQINNQISGVKKEFQVEIHNSLKQAYFFAGAKGNSAIIPPISGQWIHDNHEFFYSKQIIGKFGLKIQKNMGKPINLITSKEFYGLRNNLRIFREQYLQLSIKQREFFCDINELLQKKHPELRLGLPILGIQASVATSIGLALSPIFDMAAFGLAAAGQFAWESLSKGFRVNDQISESARRVLVNSGVMKTYTRDVLEILENFNKSIEKIFPG
jgi:hypothetical protein